MIKVFLGILFATIPLSVMAQKKIGEATLPNGRVIIVFDDMRWMYRDPPGKTVKTWPEGTINNPSPPKTSNPIRSSTVPKSYGSYSSTCGARTKSGGSCKRIVKGGGRCWQH